MGEARRRKANDSNYGRLSKDSIERERGVLISPKIVITEYSFEISSGVDPHELRSALLFWDEIAISTNPFVYVDPGPDVNYLVDCGLIKQVRSNVTEMGPGSYERIHLPAFTQLDAQEPGKWSMAMGANSFQFLGMPAGAAENMLAHLVAAIPIPNSDMAIEDILEFKQRRISELKRLQAEIDKIGEIIKTAESPATELNKQAKFIDDSCVALLRTAKETKLPFKISNVKCSFEISLTKSLPTYGFADLVLGLPTITSLLGGVAACMKITGDINRQKIKNRSSPYQYVYDIHTRGL